MQVTSFDPELLEHTSYGRSLSVLVVEDSELIRTAIRERLELGNLIVNEAPTGQIALSRVRNSLPDLILLDMAIPSLEGAQLLKMLRTSYGKHELPVVAITQGDSPSEIVQILDLEANDYITKPIDFDVLWTRTVNQLMQKRAIEYLRNAQQSVEIQIRQRTAELNSSNLKLKRAIRKRLLAEDKLQKQANYDGLTGLPNRSLARDRLAQTIARARRNKQEPCVAFLDLDNFKQVNDTLGHAAGDALLKEAARRLSACARESDTVARLGGDEFLLILEDSNKNVDASREHDLKQVGERIINSFSEPFQVENENINVSPSIGFAIFPGDGESSDALISHADAAMYRAKKTGKNSYCFYSSDSAPVARECALIESRMRLALTQGALPVRYQPTVDVIEGAVVMAEVALSWSGRGSDEVMLADNFDMARRSGLMTAIYDQLIRTSCEQIRRWRESGSPAFSLTLKLAAHQFTSIQDFIGMLKHALDANCLPADALKLEISEQALVLHKRTAENLLSELNHSGIRLILGGFGKGHTSLSCLQRYAFDAVKIDPSVTAEMVSNRKQEKLVKAIIAMSKCLGVPVIADGVETREQLKLLIDARCKYVQGIHLGGPVATEEFQRLLNTQCVTHMIAPEQKRVPAAALN